MHIIIFVHSIMCRHRGIAFINSYKYNTWKINLNSFCIENAPFYDQINRTVTKILHWKHEACRQSGHGWKSGNFLRIFLNNKSPICSKNKQQSSKVAFCHRSDLMKWFIKHPIDALHLVVLFESATSHQAIMATVWKRENQHRYTFSNEKV